MQITVENTEKKIDAYKVMCYVYSVIIENPVEWIGLDTSQYKKKKLMLKGVMYYFEDKQEFEKCNNLKKVSEVINYLYTVLSN